MIDAFTSFFQSPALGQPVWAWGILFGLVAALLLFDLGVLNKKDHPMGVRQSLRLTAFYVVIALLFGIWIGHQLGVDAALNYYTAYLVEQSLSLDNIFIISVILGYFAVPAAYQHRVLFWGIVGVIVLRGLVIGFGTAIIHEFDWVLVIFAALLIYTGVKMLREEGEPATVKENFFIRTLRKYMNFTNNYHGRRFFIHLPDPYTKRKVLFATPLFMALVTIEFADLVFAFDSLPAVMSITTDPFVVFSSNLFAIMGLRALYFALAAMLDRFAYLKFSLSFVLIFIGLKVIYGHLPEGVQIFGPIHPVVSLVITLCVLGGGILYSLKRTAHVKDKGHVEH